jgi:hypothetical protein
VSRVTARPGPQTEGTSFHCHVVCRPEGGVPEGTGVGGAQLEVVTDGPLAVVASPLPPGTEPGDRASLAAHARVVDQAFAAGVVIPLRFPTVAPSREHIVTQLLRPRRDALLGALARLEGREEVRLRLTYDEDTAVAETLRSRPSLAALRRQPEAALRLGQAIASTLRKQARRDADAAIKALMPLLNDVSIDAAGGERDVLVASVLVPRDQTDRVHDVLETWASTRPAVRLRVVGPLPPYSFAPAGTG